MRLIYLTSLIISFSVLAVPLLNVSNQLAHYQCRNEIEKMANRWVATKEWRMHIDEIGKMVLIRPTQKFAYWIILEKSNQRESLTLMNPLNAQKVTFDQKCQATLALYEHKNYNLKEGITDERLISEMLKNPQQMKDLDSTKEVLS
jgi:outer membrane biogenesis lipoprotein LolB